VVVDVFVGLYAFLAGLVLVLLALVAVVGEDITEVLAVVVEDITELDAVAL
jgi:phage-related protein